ncbi:CaiB/BaiF CoA transferase family protein [Chloroflexota bacterium]
MSYPLAGIIVLDLTQILAGPFAGRLLGDLGADVIKIEQPNTGEPSRSMGPYFLNGESYYYLGMNSNKRGMTLNLRSDRGREVLYDLVRVSDVFLENFRPSVPPRLGVDYETLKKINERIIYCSISGYGHGVENENLPAMDTNIQALAGVMSVIGEEGQPPASMGFPVGDVAGSYAAIAGIMAALFDRQRSGKGRWIDISLLDTMIGLQGYMGQAYLVSGNEPGRVGSGHPFNTPIQAFKAKDGTYLQVQCPHQRLYEMLTEAIAKKLEGYEDLPADPRFTSPEDRFKNRAELFTILAKVFASKTAKEWLDLLADIVPISPVNSIGQSLNEPSVVQRNMTPQIEHPVAGRYRVLGNPIKMGQEEVFKPAPMLGQHTDEILQQLLHYSPEKIGALREGGAF